MTYYDCVHASPAGFVSTPPLAAYYSPRVAAYTEPRPKCDAYGYSPSPSPGPRYGHARVSRSPLVPGPALGRPGGVATDKTGWDA